MELTNEQIERMFADAEKSINEINPLKLSDEEFQQARQTDVYKVALVLKTFIENERLEEPKYYLKREDIECKLKNENIPNYKDETKRLCDILSSLNIFNSCHYDAINDIHEFSIL